MSAKAGKKIIAQNKKVRALYELQELFEAGLVLSGPEVKSVRQGRVSFQDSHVRFEGGEAFLAGVHIAPYEHAASGEQDPDRERKLLLHKREIHQLMGKVEQKGLTIVPTKIYLKNGRVKAEVALARGLKVHDRREELKRRAVERDTAREISKYR
ncbi:MAG: SsrA-binding protein SmpB [Desulfovibrionales bacterium]